MAPSIGVLARRGAFSTIQAVRRTGLVDQVREIRSVNTGRTASKQFQANALEQLLAIATTSPHYAEFADKPLAEFPILSKSTLKKDSEAFRTPGYASDELVAASTSGSYGVPLTLLLTKQKKLRQQAEVIYFGNWVGYKVGSPHLYLRAKNPKSRLKLWAQNEWFASTNHPTEDWIREQVELIRRKRIHALIGYPSTIALLAKSSLAMGLKPSDFSVRSSIPIGEALREEQRDTIEAAFGGRCLSRYTAEEVGVMAAECPENRRHHINEASYIIEVLDLHEDKPSEPGELGRIVVTDLHSYAMPLIRYDIGDLGVLGPTCSCGRPTAVLERIEGRTIETISDSRGNSLNPFFINPIMNNVSGVIQYQFAQIAASQYEVRIVGKDIEDKDRIRKELLSVLGDGAQVEFHHMALIPSLPSGKRPYVINEWKRNTSHGK